MKEPEMFPHCVYESSEQKLVTSSMFLNVCALISTKLSQFLIFPGYLTGRTQGPQGTEWPRGVTAVMKN